MGIALAGKESAPEHCCPSATELLVECMQLDLHVVYKQACSVRHQALRDQGYI